MKRAVSEFGTVAAILTASAVIWLGVWGTAFADNDLASIISRADKLYDSGKFSEAKALYEEVLAIEPNHRYALSIASKSAWAVGDFRSAATYMARLRPIAHESVRLRQDLIFVLSQDNRHAEADDVRVELLHLWRKGGQREKDRIYQRDAFNVGKVTVVVSDFLEPTQAGAIRVHYSFNLKDEANPKHSSYITYGFPTATNKIMAELNDPSAGQIHAIDHHQERVGGASTSNIVLTDRSLSYEEVRQLITQYLEK